MYRSVFCRPHLALLIQLPADLGLDSNPSPHDAVPQPEAPEACCPLYKAHVRFAADRCCVAGTSFWTTACY